MSQIDKIATVLTRHVDTPGLTTAKVAKLAGVPKATVGKRIHDLRNEGWNIYTNYRMVNGSRKAYYRLSA